MRTIALEPAFRIALRNCSREVGEGASLVAQWLRIHLPMQGTRVQALVREDPTCHGAWALEPACLEPVLHNKRSHSNEKPAHHNEK